MTLDEFKKKKAEDFRKNFLNTKQFSSGLKWQVEDLLLTTIDQTAKETLEAVDIKRQISLCGIHQDFTIDCLNCQATNGYNQALSDHQALADTFMGKEEGGENA